MRKKKTICVLGATGKLGQVVVNELAMQYKIKALVRNPQKIYSSSNVAVLKGDVTNVNDLKKALQDVVAVVSVLGHGFRTPYPIQEKTMTVLIPLMEKMKIKRLITVTGSDLFIVGDVESPILQIQRKLLSTIDPYRMHDAINQQRLLEKSSLDWTVVRTPRHTNKQPSVVKVENKKPLLINSVSRVAIADFVRECIEKDTWIRKSPIIR